MFRHRAHAPIRALPSALCLLPSALCLLILILFNGVPSQVNRAESEGMSHREPFEHRARTKIVATVGPACRTAEMLTELLAAGVDVFRLNMAHGSRAEHNETVETLRKLESSLDRPIGILVDLAGPKIRLGELPADAVDCRAGELFRFVRGDTAAGADELTSNYEPLVDELSPGKMVMLADGTVSMEVESVHANHAVCRVVQPGTIRSRQGINLPGVQLSAPAMSDVDRDHAVWAATVGADFVSLSFVRAADELHRLRALLDEHGSPARVIAKIEKPEALARLEEIVDAADGLMVARGDLGVEIDVARVAVVQKEIVSAASRRGKPVIIATQMLDSMQHASRPTRAEVTDVSNAILDGGDACMLSGETAIGQYPRAAVDTMNRIALATEPAVRAMGRRPGPPLESKRLKKTTRAIVVGAGQVAELTEAKLVAVVTHSGATALALSQLRSFAPTIGMSDSPTVLRQMCLFWGVVPLRGIAPDTSDAMLAAIDAWGKQAGYLSRGDRIVLVSGSGLAAHNVIVVHEVQ